MGLLVNGEWRDQWYETGKTGGAFRRDAARFRNWITPDGAPGPSGEGGFKAEADRYHLYVSLACPWAHRALIFRALKGLEEIVSVSVVSPHMGEDGWTFEKNFPGVTDDHLFGEAFLRDVYLRDTPDMTGRVTVPLLWDKAQGRIVSNESSEIIRMFNSGFDALTGDAQDFFPEPLRAEIETINARVYDTVNNGVYKAGFATTQEAYEAAVIPLFESLDWLEGLLTARRHLAGDRATEADWRLFTTLIRFDAVYHGHFKCNRRRIADYPALTGWLREMYQQPGVAETVAFDHISTHYYASHETINPTRIVPIGPLPDFDAPHGRERLKAA
ncbi:glutathione S-transferase family protein [Rubrimonas cliftonensis]|uniref:Putative glutathione S-transferase n=1 Tax=Rubrimonas cliftonensis TaxID=89524 RepID=A0A1H4D5C6_9RHOB|nr:glutathione S-transferase family protein [Rubrimonas cliftonensis]SEA67778.1 putative glutathione S-transferase [Rubrimonas cliftonensis]